MNLAEEADGYILSLLKCTPKASGPEAQKHKYMEICIGMETRIFFFTCSAGIPLGSGRMRQKLKEKDWN